MPPQEWPDPARERLILSSMVTLGVLFGTFLPYLLFFTPVPLAVLITRHGLRTGLSTAFLSSVFVGVATQTPFTALMVLLVLGLGVVVGEALRDGLSLRQTLVVGWLVMLAALLLPYLVPNLLGLDMGEITRSWEQNIRKALEMTVGAGLTAEQVKELSDMARLIYPSMLALSTGGITLVDYWIVSRWLHRLGKEVPAFPPFARWRFPWYVAWFFIIGSGLSLFPDIFAAAFWRALAANLQVVAGCIFFVQGLALVWFFLGRWRVHPLVKALVIGALSFMPYLMQLLVLAGLLDTWFDFRRIDHRRPANRRQG